MLQRRNIKPPRSVYHRKRIPKIISNVPTKLQKMNTKSQLTCLMRLIRKFVFKRRPFSKSLKNCLS